MESLEKLYPGTVAINGCLLDTVRGFRLDAQRLEITLANRAAIELYAFNSRMLAIEAKRVGTEKFNFTGPRLGLYHDTADVREGPFVNHFINELEIALVYLSKVEASFRLVGKADLSESSVDSYWYNGPRSGAWSFEASFLYRFKTVF